MARKRDYGNGSLCQRGKRWYLRVRIGEKRKEFSLADKEGNPAKSRKEAANLAVDVLAGLKSIQQQWEDPGLKKLEQAFLDAHPGFTDKRHYKCTWKAAFERFCAIFSKVADISHEAVGKWAQKRFNEPITWSGGTRQRSTSSVNRDIACLQRLLNWAALTGKIEKNPIYGFKAYPEPPHRERILNKTETDRLLESLERPKFKHIRGIVRMALFCGMRQRQILQLRWDQLDDEKQVVVVERKNPRQVKETYEVPVPTVLWAELKAQQASATSKYVFPSPKTGRAMDNIKRSWQSLKAAAGIEDMRFHDLRHCAGTRLAAVTDLVTVAQILGHSKIETTKKYINPDLQRKKDAIEKSIGVTPTKETR